MNKINYFELEQASKRDAERFQEYEADCLTFIGDLRQSLQLYMQCAPDRLQWIKHPGNQKDEFTNQYGTNMIIINDMNKPIELVHDPRVILKNDRYYQFVFRVNFTTGMMYIVGSVKRFDNHFHLKLAKERFEIPRNRVEEFNHVAERLVASIKSHLDNRFSDFIDEKLSMNDFGGLKYRMLSDV